MALLLLLARIRTILDVWLAVTVFMALPDYSLAFLYSALRFSLGWYTARSYALIASFTVLIVLLVETTMLAGSGQPLLAERLLEIRSKLIRCELAGRFRPSSTPPDRDDGYRPSFFDERSF